jgi:hypothetical protein
MACHLAVLGEQDWCFEDQTMGWPPIAGCPPVSPAKVGDAQPGEPRQSEARRK